MPHEYIRSWWSPTVNAVSLEIQKNQEVGGKKMKHSKVILVIDNDVNVLHAVKFNLEMAGYSVLTANNIEYALKMIREQIFYLAIVDIRLEHEESIEDKSGFEIAKQLPNDIPFIVFTAYEDKENIRQAYKDVGAKELINKQDEDAAFRLAEEVDKLFAQIKLNLDLQIIDTIQLEAIARSIRIPLFCAPQPTVEDINCILQKLFYKANAINVSLLLSTGSVVPTQAGSVLLRVQPQFDAGQGAVLVVKLSHIDEIEQEANNYERIKSFLGGHRLAVLENSGSSRQVGALVYRLIGAQEKEGAIRPLNDIFFSLNTKRLEIILDRFFYQSFSTLLADAALAPIDLTEIYTNGLHLTPEKMYDAVGSFRPEALTETYLQFPQIRRKLLNPVLWSAPKRFFRAFFLITRQCLTHGDLHSQNILVDPDDHFWLIDFARVSESHALRDFAELETDIKFNLLKDEIDLNILLAFEYNLIATNSFEESSPNLTQGSPRLIHAHKIIVSLRKIASRLIALDGSMEEYYVAMLFHTLNVLRFRHISLHKKEYALLSAAIICERLQDWPNWKPYVRKETEETIS